MEAALDQTFTKILNGRKIDRAEAENILTAAPDEALFEAARQTRNTFASKSVELCSIINAKSGLCPEDCTYCAQSSAHSATVDEYPLMKPEKILSLAKENETAGVKRFSIVTSGKSMDESDLPVILDTVRLLRDHTRLSICASLGCATVEQLRKLKAAGLQLYHHNLETGKDFFPKTCSTHSYEERIQTVKNTLAAGLPICSGGILGMGESIADRLDMIFLLRDLGVKSVPVNILDAIRGTPLENMEPIAPREVLRNLAVFRLVIPDAVIRYAGGRNNLGESQKQGLLTSVNGMMVGDYLTTLGNKISDDLVMLENLGLAH